MHVGCVRRLVWRSLALVGALAPASAQGRLEARYTATIAGIPIGSGTWAIDIADTQYTAAASGSTSGLLRAFTVGKATAPRAARSMAAGLWLPPMQ